MKIQKQGPKRAPKEGYYDLDLPRGAEWMIRGAYLPSLRVQTAPLGRCWDMITFPGVTDVKRPKPGLAFSFLSEFQETKEKNLLDAGHVNVIHRLENPTTMTCYSLSIRISSISLAKKKKHKRCKPTTTKKTKIQKASLPPTHPPCHHPGSTPKLFHIFRKPIRLPTPKTKKKLTSPAMANRMPNVATATSRRHDATEARMPAAEHATAQGPGTGFRRPAKAA